jgi:Pyridoxamine 5'-phosphate oxidase
VRGRSPSERTRVRRLPERGAYERDQIDAILDAGLVCHLGFVHDGHPFVIPTLYGRVGDEASAKLREGPPKDEEEDCDLEVWAGVIPLALGAGEPQADPLLAFDVAAPVVPARYRAEKMA